MAVLRDWHSRRTRLEGEGGARGPGKFAGRGRGVPCWSASEEAAHTGRPHAGRASWWTLPFGLAGARGTRCSTLFTPFEGRLGGSHSSRLIRGRVTHARTRNARKKGFSLSLATNNTLLPSSWLAGEPNLHRACRRDHRRPRCRWRMRDPHLRPTLAGAPSRRLAARRVPPVLLALGAFLLPFLDLSLFLSLSLSLSVALALDILLFLSILTLIIFLLPRDYVSRFCASGDETRSRLMTSPRDACTVNREWHWATKERECSFIGAFSLSDSTARFVSCLAICG